MRSGVTRGGFKYFWALVVGKSDHPPSPALPAGDQGPGGCSHPSFPSNPSAPYGWGFGFFTHPHHWLGQLHRPLSCTGVHLERGSKSICICLLGQGWRTNQPPHKKRKGTAGQAPPYFLPWDQHLPRGHCTSAPGQALCPGVDRKVPRKPLTLGILAWVFPTSALFPGRGKKSPFKTLF